jgi:hypothetical protein
MRRLRRDNEFERLLAALEPVEPRTQGLDAILLQGPGSGRRVYAVERGGELLGAVALARRCLDRWGAHAVVLHADAAPLLAARIDRSPAREVTGFEEDIAPLEPHLRRLRETWALPVIRADWPIPEDMAQTIVAELPVDPRTRIATLADLDGLIELYEQYELDDIPTRFQLRRSLRRAMTAGLPMVVLEIDGRIVGAGRMLSETRRYVFWGDQTLLPEYRGRGLTRAFSGMTVRLLLQRQRGYLATVAPSNPTRGRRLKERSAQLRGAVGVDRSAMLTAYLKTPVRFRGHGRLRHALYRVGGSRRRRTPVRYRDPRR